MTRVMYRRYLLAQVAAALVGGLVWSFVSVEHRSTIETSLIFTIYFVLCTLWWCWTASRRLKALGLSSGWAWAIAPFPPFSFFLALWLWFKEGSTDVSSSS